MRRRNLVLVALVLVGSLLLGAWLMQRRAPQHEAVYESARLLDETIDRVASYYVDSLTESKLYDLAIDGMLRHLSDPYTAFLRGDDLRELTLNTTGNYSGVGIRIESSDGWITVVAPISGTPADSAGILPGDRIVAVNGQQTRGWSVDRAVSVMRGRENEVVTVEVFRPGVEEPLEFELARASVHVSSVRHSQLVSDGIGYVWLELISEQSAEEVIEAVERLRGEGARAMILDLRLNPGGVLDQGIAVSDLFLQDGAEVVETRGRALLASREYSASEPERWRDMPLIVLVNEYTASAAEIIAGALQDHDRALLLGSRTFGKGLVQTVFPLGRTEALKLTTGRWYTPVGRSIQRDRRVDSEADSMSADTGQVFHTFGGRLLAGGGGIRPDVDVSGELVTSAEGELSRALGADVQLLRDVIATYALEFEAAEQSVGDVTVTPAMRDDVLRRLRARGATVPSSTWNSAAGAVDRQLRYQILRYAFGPEAEMRRRTVEDPVVQRAIDFLQQAETSQELLELASR